LAWDTLQKRSECRASKTTLNYGTAKPLIILDFRTELAGSSNRKTTEEADYGFSQSEKRQ